MNRFSTLVLSALMILLGGVEASHSASASFAKARQRLIGATGGTVKTAASARTGALRLARFAPGTLSLEGATPEKRGRYFLEQHGAAFAVGDADEELVEQRRFTDVQGNLHISYTQVHRGVPVFGSTLRMHFDPRGELRVVNGAMVPRDELLNTTPTLSASAAEEIARAVVAKRPGEKPLGALDTSAPNLYVYRGGWLRGVPGREHLAWEVDVMDNRRVHDRVYVDAHRGFILDRLELVHELHRTVREGTSTNTVWTEGDPLPYRGSAELANQEINGLIDFAEDTFDLFSNLSDGVFLSWNGADGAMNMIYDAEDLADMCPNAVSRGGTTLFCPGTTTDDVVAHEWTHSYTRSTHNLIYAWQSGALNESYSDIFGEVVDLINGSGGDEPDLVRGDGSCSAFAAGDGPRLSIHSPAELEGQLTTGGAEFNPLPPWTVTADLELVDDGEGKINDGCEPFVDFTAGKIAVTTMGACLFQPPAVNAEIAGAVGLIIVNGGNDAVIQMFGDGNTQEIPAVMIGKTDGTAIKDALASGVVNATMTSSSETTLRWLTGEDSWSFGGAIRDMWTPGCLGDPGKVSDSRYWCSEADGGGVHTNSGVSNHAFALLVDGGEYNGHTVGSIGMTKAAHVYWRAMTVYQIPVTDFADHADLLELSCQDLVGSALTDLSTGAVSGQAISERDCAQVAEAMAAVEMRSPPTQCNFSPILSPNAPPVPGDVVVFFESFDADPWGSWSRSHDGVHSAFEDRDWEWTTAVPEGGDGGAVYAVDAPQRYGCSSAGDQSGVMHVDSPPVSLPAGGRIVLSFDHYLNTEPRYDGGNVRISVNGGEYRLIDGSAFMFNPYNRILVSAEDDNTNPLAGEGAFSGSNEGTFEGSWGQSQVDLSGMASPGDTIQIRFDLGSDGCVGIDGWYLDNVRITVDSPVRRAGGRVG